MKELLLIDSHALIHRFFHALPPLTTPKGEPIQAVYGLCRVLLKIVRGQHYDYIAAALDRPEPTFRKEQFKEYKIHRPPAPNHLISQIKQVLDVFSQFGIPSFSVAGYEADDVIGTLTSCYKDTPDLFITVLTGDLDLLQLVENTHVRIEIIKKGTNETIRYNEAQVRSRYGLSPSQLTDYKGLVGDTSDNIPGVKGVGDKTAAQLLQEFNSLDGVFENIALIEPKIAKKLEGQEKIAFLSRDLATIKCDVPLPCPPLTKLSNGHFSSSALKGYFQRLGFDSLVRQL